MNTVQPAELFLDRAWEARLTRVPARPALQALKVRAGDAVLVVTAHPDDETLGLGATIATLTDSGVRVDLVCATAGEAAFEEAGIPAPDLAEVRRVELARAAVDLGIGDVELLDIPDGRVNRHRTELTDVLTRRLADGEDVKHVLALWDREPHADHAAIGLAATEAAHATGHAVSGFPLWAFHWCDPHVLLPLGARATVIESGPFARARRRRATRRYTSQTTPPAAGVAPVVPPDVLAWTTEVLVPM